MTNEKRLEIERRIIRKYIKAVMDAGFKVHVYDGEEHHPETDKIAELLEQVTAVDEAHVICRSGGIRAMMFFVMGNEPGEVLNDYSTVLEDHIAAVNEYAEQWA